MAVTKVKDADTKVVKDDKKVLSETREVAAFMGHFGISSGLFYLDWVTADSFLFPRGTFSEVAGLQQASKTTLILQTIAYNFSINKKFKVLYMDYEKALSKQAGLASAMGVNLSSPNFVYKQPVTLEGGCAYILKALASDNYDMIVMDTLAAARPAIEVKSGFGGTVKPGYRGKLWSEFFRNGNADLDDEGPAVIVVNHLYEKIDTGMMKSFGGKQYESPGSNSLKFFAGNRFQLKVVNREVEVQTHPHTGQSFKRPVSTKVICSCEKNKVGAPYKQAEFTNTLGLGLDPLADFVDSMLIQDKIIEVSGNKSHYGLPGLGKVAGKQNFLKSLRAEPDALREAVAGDPFWSQQIDAYLVIERDTFQETVLEETPLEEDASFLEKADNFDDLEDDSI